MRGEKRVPKLDRAVRRTTTRREQAPLMRTPGYRFDSGTMLTPFERGLGVEFFPDH